MNDLIPDAQRALGAWFRRTVLSILFFVLCFVLIVMSIMLGSPTTCEPGYVPVSGYCVLGYKQGTTP